MAKLSYAELQTLVSTYVDVSKLSNATLSVVRTSTDKLVDKIGKVFTLDTAYADKLALFEGEQLQFGKTLEEWQEDLILPAAYDSTGANNDAPQADSYRPAFYSTTLGRKTFKTTIYNNDFERSVHNSEQLSALISMKLKRLYDSESAWRYDVKRTMLNKLIGMWDSVKSTATAYAATSSYTVGAYIKNSSEYGIVVKAITASQSATSTRAKCKEGGYVIVFNLVSALAKPVDATTGEAFVKQVKTDAIIASDLSEGYSLNGNSLGATEGLVLLVAQDVMPSIEVDVQAGAFQANKVAFPAEIISIKDFGGDTTSTYAILMDKRLMRLYNSYRAIRNHDNADGDFMNYVLHTEDTAHISRNCFFKIYRPTI